MIEKCKYCDAKVITHDTAQQLDKKNSKLIYAKLCRVRVDSNVSKCGKFEDHS